jgi:hypothetical protein
MTGQLTNSFIQKRDMSTVVSHGAVFRALNKEDGPQRKIMASLGVLQYEIYNPNIKANLLSSDNRREGMDGKSYVRDVIEWLIRRVCYLLSGPASFRASPEGRLTDETVKNQKLGKQVSYRITRFQLFDIDEKWIIRQRIYASLARAVRNHYHCEDEVNAGK